MVIAFPKFLIGYLLVLVGLGWYLAEGIWMSQYPVVEGKVISISPEQEEQTTYYRSTFEYRVGDEVYAVADTTRSSPPLHAVGEVVRVRYPPEKPAEGSITTWLRSFGTPLIFIISGLILIAIQKTISLIYQLVVGAIRQKMNGGA